MEFSSSNIKSLNDLCNKLDEQYDINSGGCCFVSYVIAKNLYERKIRFSLVFCMSDDYEYPKSKIELRHDVRNNSSYLTDSLNHYCIKIGKEYINPGRFIADRYYTKRSCSLIHPENIHWIYTQGSWNECFDTDNLKKVEDSIDNFFKKYDRTSRKN